MSVKGLERFRQDRDALELGVQALEGNPVAEKQLTATLARTIVESYDRIIECAEEARPFVANVYANAPELLVTLDLPWYSISQIPFLPTSEPYILDEIDEAERAGLGTEMCTLIRLGIGNVEAGRMPPPTALIGLLSPCDGADMLHQAIARHRDWRDVPMFCTDPPYYDTDRSIDFHARELRRMLGFLEEHTGAAFDINRLRETITESNKQYELWVEYNELRRAVPCPHSAAQGAQAWNVAQNYMVGNPRGTTWFQRLLDITEKRVSEGKGNVENERIRLFWFDIRAVWFP
ncbi:MAG: 2-hydroxyacyl-CoA dehydratase, partial [Dehalococcoidia bacterium]